ncbi:Hypothetical protein D9617_1g088500 [Elsinoe fawcettii]|nr:Hypothetical protein D9617_1g088500 [Elsinoe fawcettii]
MGIKKMPTRKTKSAAKPKEELNGIRRASADIPCDAYAEEMIIFVCGESLTKVSVPKSMIYNKSLFVQDGCSFNKHVAEQTGSSSGINTITLGSYDASLIRIYIAFIHTGCIHTYKPGHHIVSACHYQIETINTRNSDDAEWLLLFELHLMGHYLQDVSFQNVVADAMIEKLRIANTASIISHEDVYEHTLPGSPLRKMLVDFHIYLWQGQRVKFVDEVIESGQANFYKDYAEEMHFLITTGRSLEDAAMPWGNDPCRYHIHATTEERFSCVDRVG